MLRDLAEAKYLAVHEAPQVLSIIYMDGVQNVV